MKKSLLVILFIIAIFPFVSAKAFATNGLLISSNSGYEVKNSPLLTLAGDDDGSFEFCQSKGVLTTFKVIHTILSVARIAVPIILVIIGSINFFKAMISGDEKANLKAFKDAVLSVIIAIIVFFIPTVVYAIVGLAKGNDNSFHNCQVCFTGKGGNCQAFIDTAKNK